MISEMYSRRQAIALGARASIALGLGSALGPLARPVMAMASPTVAGLSDPQKQPKFVNRAVNALDPSFTIRARTQERIGAYPIAHDAGLVGPDGRALGASTAVFGYGLSAKKASWPGPTLEVMSGRPTNMTWSNHLGDYPIMTNAADGFTNDIVDTTAHWCYSLHGYEHYTTAADGVPTVVHLHGGHTPDHSDGFPESFASPGWRITGPTFSRRRFEYPNDQQAGTLWYHDHALGITRLNVYAGLAGFYIVRDAIDSGKAGNALGLPAGPFERAYAIQDRMFTADGRLFYPGWPDDPFWDDFIVGEGVVDPPLPSALAEFFGDHMVVNGVVWPKSDVQARQYRIRLLNGCDSRFLVIRFREAASPTATDLEGAGEPLSFDVVGSDQGLLSSPATVSELLIGPGERYDVVIDFSSLSGRRVIMDNIGGDEPFGGDIPGPQVFEATDRIMAFDVFGSPVAPTPLQPSKSTEVEPEVDRVRRVALFEGKDEFGRLQPMLGTVDPASDASGSAINWPDTDVYAAVGLVGPIRGAVPWQVPTTEVIANNSTEEWEIWNVTGDAHPVHLHLVHFAVVGRHDILWDSAIDDEPVLEAEELAAGDGTYLLDQPVVQHNDALANGFRVVNPTKAAGMTGPLPEERAPKDMVTALPGQVTRIRATFDRSGDYVWHCHILSHEDHDMMRPFTVVDL